MNQEECNQSQTIRQILRRSLALQVEKPQGEGGAYTLFCRTPEQLACAIEWLATKYPDKLELFTIAGATQNSLVDNLRALGNVTGMHQIHSDSMLSELFHSVQPYIDVMQVDLPASESATKSKRVEEGIHPAHKTTLFGIVLPYVSFRTPECGEILKTLKEFGLRECNIARIGRNDPNEAIVAGRLLQQDNLRSVG